MKAKLTLQHDGRTFHCEYEPTNGGEDCSVLVREIVDTRTNINSRRMGHFTFRVADFPSIHKGISRNLEFFAKSWYK